jgi:hypothetical protein
MTIDDEGLTMPQQTRAAVLSAMKAAPPYADSRPLSVQTVTLDPPGPGEVLVRVAAAGVCHSDLHLADGHPGPAGLHGQDRGEGFRWTGCGFRVRGRGGGWVRGRGYSITARTRPFRRRQATGTTPVPRSLR